MKPSPSLLLTALLAAALACNLARPSPPTAPPARPSPTPTARPRPTTSPTLAPEALPEAILILQPGPGSRVASPLHVAGEADPTFEQNLVLRLLLEDGSELALTATTIQADLGQRGPFEADLAFTVAEERQGFLQVYAVSARDGGITHLASVGLILAPSGPAEVRPAERRPEQIRILRPAPGDAISGGVAVVEGFGLASFEQTLVVEVVDAEGRVVGGQAVTVQAPDLGLPGPFQAEVPYLVGEPQPGRIVVRDISPAHGGDAHRTSVEITLEP